MGGAQVQQRILVVAPNWIGDALMALPLIAAIKHSWPASSVAVLAPIAVARVLRRSKLVDDAVETTWPHGGLQFGARIALAGALRKVRFDAAVILPNSFKSALVPWFARIPLRVGYVGEARRLILSRCLPAPEPRGPMVQRYLDLASLLGVESATASQNAPQLTVTSQEIGTVFERFGLRSDKNTVVLCPGAEYGPAKRWPATHFSQLAELIAAAHPEVQLVVAGAAADIATAAGIASQSKTAITVTAGRTTIDEATALLAGAQLVVSNDSGLMHIAAALQRPLVALYGSTDPGHTPPQSVDARILWLKLVCSPCFQRVCPLGHTRCLVEMTPQSVFAAIPAGTLN
jgi:heptosyltransferase-2